MSIIVYTIFYKENNDQKVGPHPSPTVNNIKQKNFGVENEILI